MKRSEAFPANYLGKDDVPAPIQATIADVSRLPVKCDHGNEDKPVMTFAGVGLKPLILNNVNWMTLEDAYGQDSDDWRGKPVEIFVDQNVIFGNKRVGGIRLRIPAGRRLVEATVQPAPRPATTPPELTLDDRHAQLLDGYSGARTEANLNDWHYWSKKYPFSGPQNEQAETRYHASLAHILAATPERRPARVGT